MLVIQLSSPVSADTLAAVLEGKTWADFKAEYTREMKNIIFRTSFNSKVPIKAFKMNMHGLPVMYVTTADDTKMADLLRKEQSRGKFPYTWRDAQVFVNRTGGPTFVTVSAPEPD